MKESDYHRLRRQIEEKYKKDIEALERVWEMAKGDSAAKVENPRIEGLTEAVKGVIREIDEPFNLRTVIAQLKEHPDRQIAEAAEQRPSSISTVLKRLEANGEIRLREKGSGKRASTYVRANPTALPLEPGDIQEVQAN